MNPTTESMTSMKACIPTSFISCHISLAEIPWEFPAITKQGHSETRTTSVSSAEIAKVTEGCPFAVLQKELENREDITIIGTIEFTSLNILLLQKE